MEITGGNVKALREDEAVERLSAAAGISLRLAGEEDKPRRDQAGAGAEGTPDGGGGRGRRRKDGETVSGDTGAWFKHDDGALYVLLCDGMGSGPAAGRESSLAVRLLEQFLRAGTSPERALKTVASALGLRGEEDGGFTTVDLLRLDLFTGEAGIYKYGAAPTYIRKGRQVTRVTGATLPAGLSGEPENPM